LAVIWIVVTYGFLSYLKAKDQRYVLPCSAPLVLLVSIGLCTVGTWLDSIAGRQLMRFTIPAMAAGLMSVLGWWLWSAPLAEIHGVQEVADFLAKVAPDEPVFYDGPLHGIFIYYVRERDDDMRRMVVRGDKLLYLSPLNPHVRARKFASTAREVVDVLRTRSGCRWFAIERPQAKVGSVRQLLREAVEGPPFHHVAAFPVTGTNVTGAIDVYRIEGEIDRPKEFEMFIPISGEGAKIKSRPVGDEAR
jgi:hypothetical protein